MNFMEFGELLDKNERLREFYRQSHKSQGYPFPMGVKFRSILILSNEQIAQLNRLEVLAAEALVKFQETHGSYNIAHLEDFQKLSAVQSNVRYVLANHLNPHATETVDSSLETLHEIVKRFGFDLKST